MNVGTAVIWSIESEYMDIEGPTEIDGFCSMVIDHLSLLGFISYMANYARRKKIQKL